MVGDKIKARRQELGLTQTELANRLGYKSKATIAKVESGVNDINQSTIVKYAAALNTTVAYLMGWEEPTGAENNAENIDYAKMLEQYLPEYEKDVIVHFRNASITDEQKKALSKLLCSNIDTYLQFVKEDDKR